MSFVSPVFEIGVFLVTSIWMNFFGFVIAFFACLVSFCQIPSFDRNYQFKVLTYSIFNVICWLVMVSILLISSSNMLTFFYEEMALRWTVIRVELGGNLPYKIHPTLFCLVIDPSDENGDFLFTLFIVFFAFCSSFILYHLKLGSLCETYFKEEVDEITECPPETTFKDTKPWIEKEMGESYYVKYFVKKISRIFAIDPKKSIDQNGELAFEFLKTVPYLDTKAITKKLRIYKRWKDRDNEEGPSLSKKLLKAFFGFLMETTVNVITISNIVYVSLFGYVAFFFYFKNENPSLFSFLPFIGIFLLGIKEFKVFIFYSQFLVGVPLIINFMLFYFSNLDLDIAQCEDTPGMFYCQRWFGYIRRSQDPDYSKSTLLKETLVKIFLFQGIFFFYRMLKFTNELFVEKRTSELNLEIEESFNRGSLPFIRIVIIQIASKFYIICLLLMLYIGTSKVSYTNMVLLIVAVVYSSKFKLIKKLWIFIYVIMNLIFLSAYFIDLLVNSSPFFNEILSKDKLELIGLPVNKINTNLIANGASNTGNKMLVMLLYICCMVQQIAGKNQYIRCYLLKLDHIKNLNNEGFNLLTSVNNWKQRLRVYTVKIYYKAGVWIAYGLNIYLPLLQSISFCRALLLILIVSTFIVHINALRRVPVAKNLYLDTTYRMWKIFLVLKVINISLLIVGVFGITTLVRKELNLLKDSSDYLILNYLGVESMEPEIILSISTLTNCLTRTFMSSNRLRSYFIIEVLTFVFTRIAMKIIQIQRLYHNNLVGYVTTDETLIQLRSQKPKLFRVYKLYHKYIIGKDFLESKKGVKLFSNISSFLARIYTSLIYVITLSISVFSNISLLMFVSLYYFLTYFIHMNKIFLQYLTSQNVEKVLDISNLL